MEADLSLKEAIQVAAERSAVPHQGNKAIAAKMILVPAASSSIVYSLF
jgi:hypothetical protein